MIDAPVLAAADGLVIYAGDEVSGMGHVLLIFNRDGSISGYGYCEDFLVEVGDHVEQSDVIAYARPDRITYQRLPNSGDNHFPAKRRSCDS